MENNANEKTTPTQPEQQTATPKEYIDAIAKIRENSVPREEYQKKVDENKALLDTLVQGGSIDAQQYAQKTMSSDELAKELMKPQTNLEYAKTALAHRSACIAEGKPDPFSPHGRSFANGLPTDEDDAQSVADLLQSCIDECNNDPEAFRALMQAHMKDAPIRRPRK